MCGIVSNSQSQTGKIQRSIKKGRFQREGPLKRCGRKNTVWFWVYNLENTVELSAWALWPLCAGPQVKHMHYLRPNACIHPAASVIQIALEADDSIDRLPAPTQRTSSSTSSTHSYQWSISTWREKKDQRCISAWLKNLMHCLPHSAGSLALIP